VWQQSWEFDSPLSHHKIRQTPLGVCLILFVRWRGESKLKWNSPADCSGNQFKNWLQHLFAAKPQMQGFSSPARQFAGSPFCIFPKRSGESKLKWNNPWFVKDIFPPLEKMQIMY